MGRPGQLMGLFIGKGFEKKIAIKGCHPQSPLLLRGWGQSQRLPRKTGLVPTRGGHGPGRVFVGDHVQPWEKS